jgi:hypothetical protein
MLPTCSLSELHPEFWGKWKNIGRLRIPSCWGYSFYPDFLKLLLLLGLIPSSEEENHGKAGSYTGHLSRGELCWCGCQHDRESTSLTPPSSLPAPRPGDASCKGSAGIREGFSVLCWKHWCSGSLGPFSLGCTGQCPLLWSRLYFASQS